MLYVSHDARRREFVITRGVSTVATLAEHKADSLPADVASVFNQAKQAPSLSFPVPNFTNHRGRY